MNLLSWLFGKRTKLDNLLAELDSPLTSLNSMSYSVELCREALALVDRMAEPKLWATLQVRLGNCLAQDPLEEQAESLEQAIAAFQQALQVYTREAFPADWAMTQNNLALAYSDRIRGERADNLEQAILYFQQALQVYTYKAFPEQWATIQNNLANAYAKRIRGERARNLEQAIDHYQQALQVRTREAFPEEWAETQINLANAYSDRIRGERIDNLEQAILHYQQALLVYTNKVFFPEQWATVQNNLANAYLERIRGERAENLEQAIYHYGQALQVYTRDTFPADWAMAQHNLALAYLHRIRGERAENIEQAIHHWQQAFQVYSCEGFPEQWATAQNSLANAYLERIRGARADSLEQAIYHYRQALRVYTHEAFPADWAMTQNNLALAYADRIRGERAENIEQAIAHYEWVLQVYTQEAFPEQWATIQDNLANAYSNRIRGERAENLEQAIDHHMQALRVRTREAFPEQWAGTQINLANAYSDRIRGERAENIEQAIRHCQQALQVYCREGFPEQWATAQSSLANAFADRIRGERSENLEQALYHYQQALQVRTREAFPADWAMTQNNLALAYADRIQGERAENLKMAISACQQSLEVRTRQAMPADHRQTQRNLGLLYFSEQRWQEAREAYFAAIAAGENLLASAYSEVGRRAEVAETSQLYARAAYCELQLGRSDNALVQLEVGKTRLLSQALALWEADVGHLPTVQRDTLGAKRQTIRELEAEMRLPLDTPARHSDRDLAELLCQARARLNQLIGTIRQDQPDFMPLGLTLPEILALIPDGGALVAPVITSQGSAVFVVPYGTQAVTEEHVIRLDQFKDENLDALLVGSETEPGWLRAYRPDDDLSWKTAIESITRQLLRQLLLPVHERLHQLGVRRIVLMPSGGLQLLPLHAAWRMENRVRRYFLDDYEVVYAPSAFALKASCVRAQNRTGQTALVAGVSEYRQLPLLHFARDEAEEVGKLFDVQPLTDCAATPDAVREQASSAAYVHLSCHGSFARGQDPLDSAVYLADDRPLTLADILGKMDLNSARLVTLSACETGITDIRQSPDEYVGLPAGFLQAGAAGVVSSLWSVNDLSTALLMIRFYENHLKGNMPPAQALRQAQLWLRDVTNAELSELFAQYKATASDAPRMAYATAQEKFREHTLRDPNERPFAHPYFWAAFAFYGA